MKTFYGTGASHYPEVWESIAYENEDYHMTARELKEEYEDERVYEYNYDAIFALVLENNNEHDKNAVAITADGQVCAYVKKGSASQVRNLLSSGERYSIEAEGGNYKYISDTVEKDSSDIKVTITFYDNQPKETIEKKQSKARSLLNHLFGV